VQILRDFAIGAAIDQCAEIFLDQEGQLLAGTFDTPLIDAVPSHDAWSAIQERSRETIYATARGVEIEAAGFEVLGGLLEVFAGALNDLATAGSGASARSRKLLQLLPPETRALEAEPYPRLLKMLDFVSGMTDSYAVALYKKVRGISLPGR
jgi:dGTPase